MREFIVTYYKSEEDMKPTSEQVGWAERYGDIPDYNWDNAQYVNVKSTTLLEAYRMFTMSNDGIVTSIEDVRGYENHTVVG